MPAMLRNDISYLPRPMVTDSVKTRQYIAGAVNFADGSAGINDNLVIGQLNYSRAHTFNLVNVAYGAYGFAGAYSNNTYTPADSYYFSTKSFYGLGGRAAANLSIPTGRVDIRLPGIELSYSKEFGDYLAYRQLVKNQPGFVSDDRSDLFSGGVTAEIIWHGAKTLSTQYGFRVFVGKNFGGSAQNVAQYLGQEVYNFSTVSYFLKIKKVYMILEGGSSTQFKVAYQL